ncbi:MAG: hypothetical protein ISEC1_P0131 [Thiomicrorhabdus sp.]|nr:MAG: hypothetical protein ISEC1_P0131 [Thiomicrorhabdus sp.]
MRLLLITYAIILILGVSAMTTGIHHLANVAGFIGAMGFLVTFFKERPEDESKLAIKMRKYWYTVFATGLFFSLIFGSFWNDEMGNFAM